MANRLRVVTATAILLGSAAAARAELVTVAWTAEAVTVVDQPFGVTVPLDTPVSGYFTFDTSTPDGDPSSSEGEYQHLGNSGFLAEFLSTQIHGSGTAFYQVDLVAGQPTLDTFRIYDGPRPVGFEGGTMSIGNSPDEEVELFLAVSEDVFDSDDLIDPFPFYTFGFLGTPHTFTLKDDRGTMLMQFTDTWTVVCGDPNANGSVTAGDALAVLKTSVGSTSCYRCVCDVDASGAVTASDALKTLKFAVGGTTIHCAICS